MSQFFKKKTNLKRSSDSDGRRNMGHFKTDPPDLSMHIHRVCQAGQTNRSLIKFLFFSKPKIGCLLSGWHKYVGS